MRVMVAGREIGLRVARCRLQVMTCRLQVATCGLRDAIPKYRGIGELSGLRLWRIHGISMAYLCNSFVLSGIDFIFGMVLV